MSLDGAHTKMENSPLFIVYMIIGVVAALLCCICCVLGDWRGERREGGSSLGFQIFFHCPLLIISGVHTHPLVGPILHNFVGRLF